MTTLEDVARIALEGDALGARSALLDWLAATPQISAIAPPLTVDPMVRSLTASLAELFADRADRPAPSWAKTIGSAPETRHLLKSSQQMKRLRELCETSGPPQLRRRGFFALPP